MKGFYLDIEQEVKGVTAAFQALHLQVDGLMSAQEDVYLLYDGEWTRYVKPPFYWSDRRGD